MTYSRAVSDNDLVLHKQRQLTAELMHNDFVQGCNLEQKELRVLGHANPPIKNQGKDQQPKSQDRGAQKGALHTSCYIKVEHGIKACTNHNKNKVTKVEICGEATMI